MNKYFIVGLIVGLVSYFLNYVIPPMKAGAQPADPWVMNTEYCLGIAAIVGASAVLSFNMNGNNGDVLSKLSSFMLFKDNPAAASLIS